MRSVRTDSVRLPLAPPFQQLFPNPSPLIKRAALLELPFRQHLTTTAVRVEVRTRLLRPPFRRHLTTNVPLGPRRDNRCFGRHFGGISQLFAYNCKNRSSCFGRHFGGISQRMRHGQGQIPMLLRPPFRRHLTTHVLMTPPSLKLLRPPFRRHLTTLGSRGASAPWLLRPPSRRHLTTQTSRDRREERVASAAISAASHNREVGGRA